MYKFYWSDYILCFYMIFSISLCFSILVTIAKHVEGALIEMYNREFYFLVSKRAGQ